MIICFITQVTKVMILSFFSFFCIIVYGTILLNSSYDVSRELFSEINSSFIKYWKDIDPKDIVVIRQSHSGSTRQAMSVLQGLPADVVTYNQFIDVQILHDIGKLIPADWKNRLPNNSSPFCSTMAFLVRKNNPKQIYDWYDLTREGIKIVFPNPRTSGNGRYTYLVAWNVFFKDSLSDINKTRMWMKKFLKNVIAFDTGGRAATSTFVDRKQGDVLINFESEVKLIQKKYGTNDYEIIIPNINILVEFPVTWVDKNVIKNKNEFIAQAYLRYLYTPVAQKIITRFGYYISAMDIIKAHKDECTNMQLFKIEDFYDDWNDIMKIHFRRGGELDKLLSPIGHN